MDCILADTIVSTALGRFLLIIHLLIAAFAIGTVTHHWWLTLRSQPPAGRLAQYTKWMSISYPLAWFFGVVIYPSYNVLIRKPPEGWLEANRPWAVGLFEIKEHMGTIALVMLPLLVLSARRFGQLSGVEKFTYRAATWMFTIFVYYSFVSGALVTAVRSF